MEQLSLEVRLADYALFETYFAGPNAAAVHGLCDLMRSADTAVLWLWGAPETGKTHLLQAGVNAADASGHRTAYLPLDPRFELSPPVLEGMDDIDVVCIDDVDAIAGDSGWEQALFGLFERLRERRGRLVLAARQAPLNCGFELPDLASRFASGATFALRPLTDDDKLKAIQLRAEWRGLHLPDDTARYLISRVDRRCAQLFTLLDALDREALAAQRKLTVPFVKAVLEK
jgi:DnaA family protein